MAKKQNRKEQDKSQNKRPTIGLLIDNISRPWELPQWQGVMCAAQERDINLICVPGGQLHAPADFRAQANVLYDLIDVKRVDGLVLWSGGFDSYVSQDELLEFCTHYHPLPIVSVEHTITGIPTVLMDDYQAMREVMVHLIEVHGYQQIAFLPGSELHMGFRERYRAYVETLAEYDLPFDENLVLPSFDDQEFDSLDPRIIPLLTSWLQERETANWEALVAFSDMGALQTLQALQPLGLQVPGDIALTGFDAGAEGKTVTPPLTTVRPPFYELGGKAVEMLLALIDGETVPEQVILPSELVVRQSCGCSNQAVVQAAARSMMVDPQDFDTILSTQREEIVMAMEIAMGTAGETSEQMEQLLDNFVADIQDSSSDLFLGHLNQMLTQNTATNQDSSSVAAQDVSSWQNLLSVLRRYLLPHLQDETFKRADDLWQQARVMMGVIAERSQAYHALQVEQQTQVMREVGQALITTFDTEQLMAGLAEGLPRLSIPACYLAVYENPHPYAYPQPAPEWSRLLLAYTDNDRAELDAEGQRFWSHELLPAELWPKKRRYSFVLEALYFKENQLGYVLFEVGPPAGIIYDTLRTEISGALWGALLVEQVQNRSADLARQKYILDSFMENVPDTIYFKDLDSRVTQVNQALVDRFGLNDATDFVGKTDFDFFPPQEAQAKYEVEQEIIRTGQPVLNIEEPDGGGHWALTTKMPLRDEHGQVIGTFGISRDITPVKQVQEIMAKQARQLQTVAEVSTTISIILDTAKLLQQVVDLTKERFGLYHAHIYLLNEAGDALNLAAGAGEAGQKMAAEGWRIPLLRKQSLVAQAARTGQEVMVNNVQAAPDWLPNPLLPDTCAELAVPLIVADKVLGVFDVQADRADFFAEEDAGIYATLASQVAATLQNVNLYAETAQRATELETLSQISRQLSTMLDPEHLIPTVVEQIGTAFNYYYTQIYLYDEARENLLVAGGTGELGKRLVARQHSLPNGRGLVGRAAEQNKIVMVPDVQRHVGVEIVTQANVDGIYQREVDPEVEDEWYTRYITEHFGDVKALVEWLNMISDQTGPPLKMGYVLHVGGVFPKMMRRGVEAAARDLQVEVDLVAPERESEHLPLFEKMVEQGVDGLVVVPDKPEWVAPIEKALVAGIPVVTANRDLKSSPALMHVGLDNFQAGMILAREMTGLLSRAGKEEGKILVSTGVADRIAGVKHGLRHSNYTLIEIEGFLEDASFLKTYWEQAINHHPHAIATIGLTVSEAPILAEIKRHLGGQWLVGGFDLELETLDAIRDGTVQVTIGQHTFLQAYLPILALVEHIRQGTSLRGWMAEGWLPNALLPRTQTEVAVPIALGDEVLGVLDVQNDIAGSLRAENANLLHSVADQVAVALTNARLFDETTRSKEEAELAKDKAEQARAAAEQAQQEIEIANRTLEVQMWQTKGQAELNDKMRGEQELVTLADNIIRQLCHYLEAQIGALYIVQDQSLSLIGSYAYNSKQPTTHFKFGQGLVGQAAVEKKLLLISNVPDDYITISSGWGETAPRHVMVFPFMYEDQVAGVVELGTLTEFNQIQLDFMEIALGSIGIAFNTAQARVGITTERVGLSDIRTGPTRVR